MNMLREVPVPDWMNKRDIKAEAAKLRQLRTELGWSQEQTAARVGVRLRAYARWEAGGSRCQLSALEVLERLVADARQEKKPRKRGA